MRCTSETSSYSFCGGASTCVVACPFVPAFMTAASLEMSCTSELPRLLTVPPRVPVLDLAPFRADEGSHAACVFVEDLRAVCHEHGFFSLVGHGVAPATNERVQALARRFFALPERERLAIANIHSPQFRGYTPVGHEHTQGHPDRRDQLDIGHELPLVPLAPGDPAWLRLRGPNLWPAALPELRPAVETWIDAMERLGHTLCRGSRSRSASPPIVSTRTSRPGPKRS